jgi:autotransporter-associated beta strand protein
VSAGTLALSGAGTLGNIGNALTVSGSGTLDLGGTTQTQNGGVTLSGGTIQNGTLSSSGTFGLQSGTVSAILAGSGGVSKTTAGTVTLSGANTYTGGTTVSAGTLALSGTGTLGNIGNALTVSGSGTLDLGGTTQTQNGGLTLSGGTIQNGTLSSSGTFGLQSGTVNAVLAGSGGVSKTTAGTVTLSGVNTYTGATTINGGTLALTGGGSIATSSGVNILAGTFDISGTTAGATIQTLSGVTGSSVTLGGQTLTLSNASGTFAGGITGTGGLSITGGTETLSGTSTYTGTTSISAGAGLTIASGGVLGTAGSHTSLVTNSGTLTVDNGGSLTADSVTNNAGGTIDVAGGTITAATTLNSGTVVATGISTINGAFTNETGGVVDLTRGATPTANQLNTGSFTGKAGSAVDVLFNFSTVGGAAGLLSAKGTSGTTTVNFGNVTPGTAVVLGNAVTVIKDTTGTGTLNPTGATETFGLVNVSVQSDGHGGADLVRTLNVGATAAPAASVMAALSAIDTSFHQSTAPFVVSPQSDDPDKWTGGVWSRATAGQTTAKSTAFESFGGTSADLRVKTNFEAYEAGIDTGILNFGGSGWNGHFGVMAGAVTATANELLSGSGTSVKFDVPFAGVYGVMTHGPFFMDVEARHDWVNTRVTNITANLVDTPLKGRSDSLSGSAGYHFDLVDHWFVEPTAGVGLTQTQFDTLATNLNQANLGIAPGAVSFDTLSSFLVHGGARVGTSFVVSDTLALQPFGTLSVWRELSGQSDATFTNGGVSDPLTLSRVGTFYQAGLGLSAQVLNTGFVGFARGDIRWGDNLNGMSIVGGLRYTFGP